ncbi:cell division cycle-associated protein 2 isoform X4 [Larimichthys crocea]|uniref:cell division cycle-associated protein 2 isoform X4 n=1 Tax=Larimichthys crocea TaxID=215358 RepID=UPI000901F78D|nr:cell division cycle-associated protein 2 isoform X4 [Larimichthys crocea]
MANVLTEGNQLEKVLSPSEEVDCPPVLDDTSAPLNFSGLTPCQFGISAQSFTPASLSNRKDKSRLAQIKLRRRSNIGVRGSPETNSLIRFMAQQRMKTPPTFQTPEQLVRGSPFTPRVASTLRQKMASFQNLMDVEESEVCGPEPRQDSNTGRCIKTRDYLSDGNSHNEGKENHQPPVTPTPSKRRRLGPLETCELEIRESSAPNLNTSLKEQKEDEEPVTQTVTQEPLPSCETVEEAQAVVLSPPFHVDFELQACSPTKKQQDSLFELQSQPPDDPAATSPSRPASSFHIPSFPSLLEMKPTEDDDSTEKSTVKIKKKSVCFGGPLSPEFFDKNLPPSTPLQKGGTPARAPTPGGSLKLRSLLKTPQRSESQTPQTQPDLCSPTAFGASPTLAMPRSRRVRCVEEDSGDGKQPADSAVTHDTECTWDTQPLNLNNTFHEESLSQMVTENTPSQLNELMSLLKEEEQHEAGMKAEAPAQTRNQRKQQPPECESTSKAPVRSSSRKRKSEESEPVKRSTRSAAKLASGKMKTTSTAARQWNRDVDRSLYGSRAYASKNPTLSPITERLSFSQGAQQAPSMSCTAPNHETKLNPEMINSCEGTDDPSVSNALENPSEDSITSANSSKESTTGKDRRLSGPRVRGRGLKKRKVSVADDVLLCKETLDQTGGKTEDPCEDQTSTKPEESKEAPLTHTDPEQEGVNTKLTAQTSADTHHIDLGGKLERDFSLEATTLDCPPSGEESNIATSSLPLEPAQRKTKRGRRRSVNSSVLQEQGNQTEEHQMSHEVEEKDQGDQAARQQENSIRSSSDSQEEEGAATLSLAPWQCDFNFEDVFKPVTTRGQRSVRRSLRNQNNDELSSNSAGLAWLPRTSPDSSKESRRRTRGRRLSTAPPVQPPLPEEAQDTFK